MSAVAEDVAAPPDRAAAARDRKVAWAVRLGTLLIRALATTWRIRVVHDAGYRALLEAGTPFVYSLWHGQMLPLLWHHRGTRAAILISEHRDGEIIARIAESLGYRTIRGSTSRGGGRALLALARDLQAGGRVAVTPDGPRGPAHVYAPGALVAAQRAGAPIVVVVAAARRSWRLRSWDRFMIPKPFARVTIAYGDPTPVAGATPREAAAEGERFGALHRAVDEAAAEAERRA